MVKLDKTDRIPQRRGGRIVLVVVVVIAMVALAVAAFILGRDGQGGDQHSAAPSPTLDTEVPQQPPRSVQWELYRGFALPVSEQHGPEHRDGAVATGFARTPVGALLACEHIIYGLTLAPDHEQAQTIAQNHIVGSGQSALAQQLRSVDRSGSPAEEGVAQIAGFRFVSYDRNTAVIDTASGTAGEYTITTVVLRWQDGDWRVELADANAMNSRGSSDLAGLIPWSGVE